MLTEPTGAFPELGWWFIALAGITAAGALAALLENLALSGGRHHSGPPAGAP